MASTVITVEPLFTLSPGLTNTYIQEGYDPVHEAYIMVINIQRRDGIMEFFDRSNFVLPQNIL